MKNVKNIKRMLSNIIVILWSLLCFPLFGRAETISVPNGNSHLITGYATEINYEYKVDVVWAADMTFVFDRGKYDTSNTMLIRASTVPGAEKGAQDGEVNRWYGFDGIRNRVVVLNRSNMNIYAKYASSIDKEVCGEDVEFQLYDYKNNDDYIMTINQETYWPDDFDDYSDYEYDTEYRFGNEQPIAYDKAKLIKAAPGDGTMYANKVFLNITGTPIDSFQKYELDADDKPKTADMGHITITFNTTES